MKKPAILLTGANGQLGRSLLNLPLAREMADWIITDLPELDITDRQATALFVERHTPDFIINCAAYTAVDRAENDFDSAYAVNAVGPENLALAAKQAGIPLIHLSTDYVFSGQSSMPYTESDRPDPRSAYGRTKLAGETALLKTGGRMIIVRTSWLFSEFGTNFFLTMLRLGGERQNIRVVADQVGSPTYAGHLAEGLMKMVDYYHRFPGEIQNPEIFHFANTGIASWHDLARYILETAGLACHTVPVSTAEYPLPAPRPAYSILDTKKFSEMFRQEIPNWRNGVNCCFEKLAQLKSIS